GAVPGLRCWHLDHHVRTVNALTKPQALFDRLFSVLTIFGKDFNTHVAIDALGGVVDLSQLIGRTLNVGDHEIVVDLLGALSFADQIGKSYVVVFGTRNCLVEDAGIARAAKDSVLEELRKATI